MTESNSQQNQPESNRSNNSQPESNSQQNQPVSNQSNNSQPESNSQQNKPVSNQSNNSQPGDNQSIMQDNQQSLLDQNLSSPDPDHISEECRNRQLALLPQVRRFGSLWVEEKIQLEDGIIRNCSNFDVAESIYRQFREIYSIQHGIIPLDLLRILDPKAKSMLVGDFLDLRYAFGRPQWERWGKQYNTSSQTAVDVIHAISRPMDLRVCLQDLMWYEGLCHFDERILNLRPTYSFPYPTAGFYEEYGEDHRAYLRWMKQNPDYWRKSRCNPEEICVFLISLEEFRRNLPESLVPTVDRQNNHNYPSGIDIPFMGRVSLFEFVRRYLHTTIEDYLMRTDQEGIWRRSNREILKRY